jgi:hypothetical protein
MTQLFHFAWEQTIGAQQTKSVKSTLYIEMVVWANLKAAPSAIARVIRDFAKALFFTSLQ